MAQDGGRSRAAVLVVGAGPVGLALAAELARLGIPVRIVDKAPAPGAWSKALVLWRRTLELMEIMGCAGEIIAAGIAVPRVRIQSGRRTLLSVTFPAGEGRPPYALNLPQSETERLLQRHLAALGVTVERGCELAGFRAGSDAVAATLVHGDGRRKEETRFAWLVGCDGAHSTVRHGLALPFEGETETSAFILADVALDGAEAFARELGLFWHGEGVLGIFPILPGRFRVIADLGADLGAGTGGGGDALSLAEVQAVLDRRGPGGVRARDPVWLSRFHINERKVRDYRRGRVFLAGDAAHIHSPAGGQGMNTGIQDACNLAWKLALACRGRTRGETLLESYSSERSAVGRRVLRNATALTRIATLRNPWLQRVRNEIVSLAGRLPALQRRFTAGLGELDIAYPRSPLSRQAPGAQRRGWPQPGARVADRAMADADGSAARLYRLLRGGRFVLAVGSADAATRGAAEALRARFAGTLALAFTQQADSALAVIRPDGYLGLLAAAGDWASVESYLGSLVDAG